MTTYRTRTGELFDTARETLWQVAGRLFPDAPGEVLDDLERLWDPHPADDAAHGAGVTRTDVAVFIDSRAAAEHHLAGEPEGEHYDREHRRIRQSYRAWFQARYDWVIDEPEEQWQSSYAGRLAGLVALGQVTMHRPDDREWAAALDQAS